MSTIRGTDLFLINQDDQSYKITAGRLAGKGTYATTDKIIIAPQTAPDVELTIELDGSTSIEQMLPGENITAVNIPLSDPFSKATPKAYAPLTTAVTASVSRNAMPVREGNNTVNWNQCTPVTLTSPGTQNQNVSNILWFDTHDLFGGSFVATYVSGNNFYVQGTDDPNLNVWDGSSGAYFPVTYSGYDPVVIDDTYPYRYVRIYAGGEDATIIYNYEFTDFRALTFEDDQDLIYFYKGQNVGIEGDESVAMVTDDCTVLQPGANAIVYSTGTQAFDRDAGTQLSAADCQQSFDGDENTYPLAVSKGNTDQNNSNYAWRWPATNCPANVTSIKVYCEQQNSAVTWTYWYNDDTSTQQVISAPSNSLLTLVNPPSTLTSLTISGPNAAQGTGNSYSVNVAYVMVNDTILIDNDEVLLTFASNLNLANFSVNQNVIANEGFDQTRFWSEFYKDNYGPVSSTYPDGEPTLNDENMAFDGNIYERPTAAIIHTAVQGGISYAFIPTVDVELSPSTISFIFKAPNQATYYTNGGGLYVDYRDGTTDYLIGDGDAQTPYVSLPQENSQENPVSNPDDYVMTVNADNTKIIQQIYYKNAPTTGEVIDSWCALYLDGRILTDPGVDVNPRGKIVSIDVDNNQMTINPDDDSPDLWDQSVVGDTVSSVLNALPPSATVSAVDLENNKMFLTPATPFGEIGDKITAKVARAGSGVVSFTGEDTITYVQTSITSPFVSSGPWTVTEVNREDPINYVTRQQGSQFNINYSFQLNCENGDFKNGFFRGYAFNGDVNYFAENGTPGDAIIWDTTKMELYGSIRVKATVNSGKCTVFVNNVAKGTITSTNPTFVTLNHSGLIESVKFVPDSQVGIYSFEIDGQELIDYQYAENTLLNTISPIQEIYTTTTTDFSKLQIGDPAKMLDANGDVAYYSPTSSAITDIQDGGFTSVNCTIAWNGFAGNAWPESQTWNTLTVSNGVGISGGATGTGGSQVISSPFTFAADSFGVSGASGSDGWALMFDEPVLMSINPVNNNFKDVVACLDLSQTIEEGAKFSSFPAVAYGRVFWIDATAGTFPAMTDLGSLNEAGYVLTLQNNTDLKYFVAPDIVQGNTAPTSAINVYDSSGNVLSPGQYVLAGGATVGATSNQEIIERLFFSGQEFGAMAAYTTTADLSDPTATPSLADLLTYEFEFEYPITVDDIVNNQIYAIIAQPCNLYVDDVLVGSSAISSTAQINMINNLPFKKIKVVPQDGEYNISINGTGFYGLRQLDLAIYYNLSDGDAYVVDSDPLNNKLTVSGGLWSTTSPNQTQNWTAGFDDSAIYNPGESFNGILSGNGQGGNNYQIWSPTTPISFSDALGGVEVWQEQFNNDWQYKVNPEDTTVPSSIPSDQASFISPWQNDPTGSGWYKISTGDGTLTNLGMYNNNLSNNAIYLGGLRVNGVLLVDNSVSLLIQTSVTGTPITGTGIISALDVPNKQISVTNSNGRWVESGSWDPTFVVPGALPNWNQSEKWSDFLSTNGTFRSPEAGGPTYYKENAFNGSTLWYQQAGLIQNEVNDSAFIKFTLPNSIKGNTVTSLAVYSQNVLANIVIELNVDSGGTAEKTYTNLPAGAEYKNDVHSYRFNLTDTPTTIYNIQIRQLNSNDGPTLSGIEFNGQLLVDRGVKSGGEVVGKGNAAGTTFNAGQDSTKIYKGNGRNQDFAVQNQTVVDTVPTGTTVYAGTPKIKTVTSQPEPSNVYSSFLEAGNGVTINTPTSAFDGDEVGTEAITNTVGPTGYLKWKYELIAQQSLEFYIGGSPMDQNITINDTAAYISDDNTPKNQWVSVTEYYNNDGVTHADTFPGFPFLFESIDIVPQGDNRSGRLGGVRVDGVVLVDGQSVNNHEDVITFDGDFEFHQYFAPGNAVTQTVDADGLTSSLATTKSYVPLSSAVTGLVQNAVTSITGDDPPWQTGQAAIDAKVYPFIGLNTENFCMDSNTSLTDQSVSYTLQNAIPCPGGKMAVTGMTGGGAQTPPTTFAIAFNGSGVFTNFTLKPNNFGFTTTFDVPCPTSVTSVQFKNVTTVTGGAYTQTLAVSFTNNAKDWVNFNNPVLALTNNQDLALFKAGDVFQATGDSSKTGTVIKVGDKSITFTPLAGSFDGYTGTLELTTAIQGQGNVVSATPTSLSVNVTQEGFVPSGAYSEIDTQTRINQVYPLGNNLTAIKSGDPMPLGYFSTGAVSMVDDGTTTVADYSPLTTTITNIVSNSWISATPAEPNPWYAITYGEGKFVAVAYTGTNRVMYSTNGINWTAAAAAKQHTWRSITYGAGKFVAVAYDGFDDGQVMYSTDAATWTSAASPEQNQWYSVTYGNGKFVAVAATGTNRVMYSADGITWTSAVASDQSTWLSVTFGNGRFVAVASSGPNQVMYSDDGINWTGATAADSPAWYAVTYGGGKYVAIADGGDNRSMYSNDGVSWSLSTSAGVTSASNWYGITYGNNTFIAVASTGTKRVMYSFDGISWKPTVSPEANSWDAVVYGGDKFVALATTGTQSVMWSYTGTGGKTLTLTNNQDLKYFQPGDVVENDTVPVPATQDGVAVVHSDPGSLPAFFSGLPTISYAQARTQQPASQEWDNVLQPGSISFTYQLIEFIQPVSSVKWVAPSAAVNIACSADGVTWEQLNTALLGSGTLYVDGSFKYWYIGFAAATADGTQNYYLTADYQTPSNASGDWKEYWRGYPSGVPQYAGARFTGDKAFNGIYAPDGDGIIPWVSTETSEYTAPTNNTSIIWVPPAPIVVKDKVELKLLFDDPATNYVKINTGEPEEILINSSTTPSLPTQQTVTYTATAAEVNGLLQNIELTSQDSRYYVYMGGVLVDGKVLISDSTDGIDTVISVNPSANQMIVSGGPYGVFNASQTWSNFQAGTTPTVNYELTKAFDGNVNTDGGVVSGGNWNWTWTASFEVPNGSTLHGKFNLGDGDRNLQIDVDVDGVTTTVRGMSPGTGIIKELDLYTNTTGSTVTLSNLKFTNQGTTSQTGAATIYWIAVDSVVFVDAVPSGGAGDIQSTVTGSARSGRGFAGPYSPATESILVTDSNNRWIESGVWSSVSQTGNGRGSNFDILAEPGTVVIGNGRGEDFYIQDTTAGTANLPPGALLVERAGVSYRMNSLTLDVKLDNTDLLLISRLGTSYKVDGATLKSYINTKLAHTNGNVLNFTKGAPVPFYRFGYYPLYATQAQAQTASGQNTSESLTLGGKTYYMPTGAGVTQFKGNYTTAFYH